jgi:ATP-dependent 26S proteasome regulatory subunit
VPCEGAESPAYKKKRSDQTMTIEINSSLYTQLKALEQELEFLQVQEDYIKDEQKNLKRELVRAQEEVKRIQSVPLVIGQVCRLASTCIHRLIVHILSYVLLNLSFHLYLTICSSFLILNISSTVSRTNRSPDRNHWKYYRIQLCS